GDPEKRGCDPRGPYFAHGGRSYSPPTPGPASPRSCRSVASIFHGGRGAILSRAGRLSGSQAVPRCIAAGMELFRTTPLEFRSGRSLGRSWETVSMNDVS